MSNNLQGVFINRDQNRGADTNSSRDVTSELIGSDKKPVIN